MWSIKGEICAIKDMNRINKIRNRLDVLDVVRSFSMTYSSKAIQFPVCTRLQPAIITFLLRCVHVLQLTVKLFHIFFYMYDKYMLFTGW